MADLNDYPSKGTAGVGSTVSSLLQRVRVNDQEAWDRMVSLYYPLVFCWCERQGLQRHDVLEVIQEVFAAVLKSLHSFQRDQTGSFRGWLSGITRHKLQDYWRRQAGNANAVGGSDALRRIEELPDPLLDESSEASDKRLLIHRALELQQHEFHPNTWQAAWRVVVEGDTPAQAAAELGISRNAVYKAKARVLARIRDEMHELLE